MASLIGINPNQVPTNSDLGRLAFLDYIGVNDIIGPAGIGGSSGISGGSGLSPTALKTSAYNAVANDLVRCNTTAGAFNVTLPAFPTDGDMIAIIDIYNTFNTNNLIVLPNGKNIESDSTSLILDVNGAYISLVYNAVTSNWKIQNTPMRNASSSSNGKLIPTAVKTASYTAVASDLVRCNSTAGSFNITFPASPADGDMIGIIDIVNACGTNNISILSNGKTIEGDTVLNFDVNGGYESFIYNSVTSDWKLLNTSLPAYTFAGGGLTPTGIKTSAYTAVANDLVRCNTTAGSFNVILPASPTDGTVIGIIDIYNTFGTYSMAVLPNGKTIEGDSTSLIFDVNGSYASFVYNSATLNWKLQYTPLPATSGTSGNGLLPTALKTSAYTAVASELVRCNSTAGSFNITFPASPADGDMIGVIDIYNICGTNNISILPNGKTIEGDITSFILDVNGAYESFVYNSVTSDWKIQSTPLPPSGVVAIDPATVLSGVVKGSGTTLSNATAGVDFVNPNTATVFTKPQRPSLSADTAPASNTITWDLTSNQIFRINLTENITTFNLTGTLSDLVGNQYELIVRYNGGSTISWNSNMKWSNATSPALTAVNNKLDIITFVVVSTDGVNFYLVNTGIKLNVG